MRLRAFLCIAFPVLTASLSANIRAPVRIERTPSRLVAKPAQLSLSGESLQFDCPAAHTGKPDMAQFARRTCTAHVTYEISAAADEKVALSFVYSGGDAVEWELGSTRITATSRAMRAEEKLHCTFCPEDMRLLRVSETKAEIHPSLRRISLRYEQALDYDERGHSYFGAGTWTQGFTYELWPLAEWQWDTNIRAKITLKIAARPGFLGIGYKSDKISCMLLDGESQAIVPLTIGDVEAGKRTATAEIELQKKPQRLRCSWSAE